MSVFNLKNRAKNCNYSIFHQSLIFTNIFILRIVTLIIIYCFRSLLRIRILVNIDLFIYLGFYIAFNTVQVISRQVVGRAEETSTYSSLGFCTVNCRPTASNYQLSHLRPCRESNPGLRRRRRECYHSSTMAPEY